MSMNKFIIKIFIYFIVKCRSTKIVSNELQDKLILFFSVGKAAICLSLRISNEIHNRGIHIQSKIYSRDKFTKTLFYFDTYFCNVL